MFINSGDNGDIFATFLLILLYFSSKILSSVVTISFYIHSKRFFLKREKLSDVRIVSVHVNSDAVHVL